MSAENSSSMTSGRSQRGLLIFMGVSVVLHVGGLGAWVLVSNHRAPPISPDSVVIKTKLVKLGKKRKEKMLPRKTPKKAPAAKTRVPDAPQPQPPKPEAPKVEDKAPPPPPEEAPKPTAAGILKDFATENDTKERPDLNKLINKVTDEGDEKGSKIGTEISGRLKAEYNDKVLKIIETNLTAPATIDPSERIRLKTKVEVHISASGSVSRASVYKTSGNELFDNAALRAAKTSKFDPPPIQLRDFYQKGGVVVTICPGQCA